MKISVIIPAYNENNIIADNVRRVASYMEQSFSSYEIIVCDDGSTDGTNDTVRSLGLEHVRVIENKVNLGKGNAVRLGMLSASGDIRVFTDADLAYGVEVIGQACEILCNSADIDIIIGSRNIVKGGYAEYGFLRRVMSKTYVKLVCFMGGFKLSDCQCGFKVFSAQAVESIFSECKDNGFAFDFEVMLRAQRKNMRICEMPVKIISHKGSSVKPIRHAFTMLKDVRRIKKMLKSEK
jgi:dolichyl-phosphate beta-glucosyltransferase